MRTSSAVTLRPVSESVANASETRRAAISEGEIVLRSGDASIILKRDGSIVVKGNNVTIEPGGDIQLKAGRNVVLKEQKILEN